MAFWEKEFLGQRKWYFGGNTVVLRVNTVIFWANTIVFEINTVVFW